MRISDWSSDVCSSDLEKIVLDPLARGELIAGKADAETVLLDLLAGVATARTRPPRAKRLIGSGRRAREKHEGGKRSKPDRGSAPDRGQAVHAKLLSRPLRSEERRVGKEGVSPWRLRWVAYP